MSKLKHNWEKAISIELTEEEIKNPPKEEITELYDCFVMYFAQVQDPKLDPPFATNYMKIKKIAQEIR